MRVTVFHSLVNYSYGIYVYLTKSFLVQKIERTDDFTIHNYLSFIMVTMLRKNAKNNEPLKKDQDSYLFFIFGTSKVMASVFFELYAALPL